MRLQKAWMEWALGACGLARSRWDLHRCRLDKLKNCQGTRNDQKSYIGFTAETLVL